MKHARSDYDSIQPWPTKRVHLARGRPGGEVALYDDEADWMEPVIPDDEPVFLIRGQDVAAIPAALAWCKAADDLGADPAIIQAVERHIEVVRQWQMEHTAKVPDAPASALR